MLPMHLELIHVSHCCRTWREMPLPASEHVSPALILLPSPGHSSTVLTTIIYCGGINNCSLGKRYSLLNWAQSPKHFRVHIHSGFPGSEVRNLLCALGDNCRVSCHCLSFSRQHWEPAGGRAVLSPLQVPRYRDSLWAFQREVTMNRLRSSALLGLVPGRKHKAVWGGSWH